MCVCVFSSVCFVSLTVPVDSNVCVPVSLTLWDCLCAFPVLTFSLYVLVCLTVCLPGCLPLFYCVCVCVCVSVFSSFSVPVCLTKCVPVNLTAWLCFCACVCFPSVYFCLSIHARVSDCVCARVFNFVWL